MTQNRCNVERGLTSGACVGLVTVVTAVVEAVTMKLCRNTAVVLAQVVRTGEAFWNIPKTLVHSKMLTKAVYR